MPLTARGSVNIRRLKSGTLDWIVGCVSAGIGITMLPRTVVARAEGQRPGHPPYRDGTRPCCLVHSAARASVPVGVRKGQFLRGNQRWKGRYFDQAPPLRRALRYVGRVRLGVRDGPAFVRAFCHWRFTWCRRSPRGRRQPGLGAKKWPQRYGA